jgi:hypothetical protein
VDYYHAFDEQKIFWPELAKVPRFSWNADGAFVNNKGYILPTKETWLLGMLGSRVTWFVISKIGLGLGERAGLERFQLFAQFTSRIPIPNASLKLTEQISKLSLQITTTAQNRYELHQQTRHRILTDLGAANGKLNNALTAWWELEFPNFRTQVKKVFKRDIPLKERHEWEGYLADVQQQQQQLTSQIIALETELNQHVYDLFHLTPEEIQIIETSTKYPYGEV